MDGYSEDRGEFDAPFGEVAVPTHDAIGSDERRMHVRAYNHWCSLLDGRDFPSVEDLDPADLADFGPHSVLLDFTAGIDNPATSYIGSAVREECGLAKDGVRTIAEVPSRSLLSRLTGHYMEIVANRAPVGFEAEFVNQRSHTISYRGILMPFSSDGDTIDFIYGVINWKDAGAVEPVVVAARLAPIASTLAPAFDEPEAEEEDFLDLAVEGAEHHEHLTWEDGPLAEVEAEPALPPATVEPDAGLADRLCAARECAEVCKAADGRSRAALYRALALAYDFAVAAKRVPGDYAEILDDAGVKAQARAPMTPIVKLVFGANYDKTRLTEFASALSNAERNAVDFGGFEHFLGAADGGLKGLVAAERLARRPADAPVEDKSEAGRIRLRGLAPIRLQDLPTNQEFALVMVRRNHAGHFEPVALVDDPATLEKSLRRFA